MAGDWIAVRKDLDTTREVLFIAQHTGKNIETVVYAILRLWWWFDSEATNGFVSGLCPAFVHNFLGQDEVFWRTVVESGWLIEQDGGLAIPNPDNWHSKTAKARLLDSRRKRDSRKKVAGKSPDPNRTGAGQKSDAKRTTGQDRTVDKESPLRGRRAPSFYDVGVGIFVASGMTETQARAFLGGLAKDRSKQVMADAVAKLSTAGDIADPKAYIVGILKSNGKGAPDPYAKVNIRQPINPEAKTV